MSRVQRNARGKMGRFLILASIFVSIAMICSAVLTIPGGTSDLAIAAEDLRRAPYLFSVDEVTDGKSFSGASIYVYENYVLPENKTLTLAGWLATDEGVDFFEYAWVEKAHSAPTWQRVDGQLITPRPDLTAAGIPYAAGHGSAGFSVDIKLETKGVGGYGDLYVRAVTKDSVKCDVAVFSHMMYGTPDKDDGNDRIVSFARLQKTEGALENASMAENRLLMTHRSMVALGKMNLGEFGRIKITYSVSGAHTGDRQALIGFKSKGERVYGDGEGLYDLTDHIVALPLTGSAADEVYTAELDVTKADLPNHKEVYLSTYLKDGVTLTVHSIEMTYRGKGYDRTNAKFYFSSDLTDKFSGINRVELKGVQDPVMGEVLRVEVKEETNDPYAHFNAYGLLKDYDLRLSADDYKYMVVLARASAQNRHNSMTFYLCAGSIIGATEACTYTHTLINDGGWHYYVFDLTERENWKGMINGWRFDIINGDSAPGNYVDFATIQLFSTLEEATEAANASVSQNVKPHALGDPAVERKDPVAVIVSDAPVSFKDGDWFAETTAPETQPPAPPEETEQTEPVATTPSEGESTAGETQPPTDAGCSSTVASTMVFLIWPIAMMIKKKKTEDF